MFHVSVVLGVDVMVDKICPHDGGICTSNSCDEILMDGRVVCCERHGNVRGRFRFRKVA